MSFVDRLSTVRLRLWQFRKVGLREAIAVARFKRRCNRADGLRRRLAEAGESPLQLDDCSGQRRLVTTLSLPDASDASGAFTHEVDLLGSGPVSIDRDTPPELPMCANKVHDELQSWLPETYRCIDWHRDQISGHVWPVDQWHTSVRSSTPRGADVKWPWELGRLQDLPVLASRIAAANPIEQARLAEELRARIIDFAASNPPGFGVQWACAMDVGIRILNLTLAVDLAAAAGHLWDAPFQSLVAALIEAHAVHLECTLEWHGQLSTNHLLGGIVGLLACGAYGLTAAADARLVHAGQLLMQSIEQQFHEDGSNFEASTCYHCLSTELSVIGCALLLGSASSRGMDPVVRIPSIIQQRLLGMADFIDPLVLASGFMPQIGDNDSGRAIDLCPGQAHLPDFVRSLFKGSVMNDSDTLGRWLQQCVGDAALPAAELKPQSDGLRSWSSFGLYAWTVGALSLTVRCGSLGQHGKGGHAHSDQLSMTLALGGNPIIIDAGTGHYTRDEEVRRMFRSRASHSAPQFGVDPCDSLAGRVGLFQLHDHGKPQCLSATATGASLCYETKAGRVERSVEVTSASLRVHDRFEIDSVATGSRFLLSPDVQIDRTSDGVLLRSAAGPRLQVSAENLEVETALCSPSFGSVVSTKAFFVPAARGSCEVLMRVCDPGR